MTDRIPCLNPPCRRTAPADKYEPGDEIVCGKCWKLLPPRLTARYKALKRRDRRLDRLALKGRHQSRGPQWERVTSLFTAAQGRNWAAIRACFLQPEKPVGLEAFLDEVGLA